MAGPDGGHGGGSGQRFEWASDFFLETFVGYFFGDEIGFAEMFSSFWGDS